LQPKDIIAPSSGYKGTIQNQIFSFAYIHLFSLIFNIVFNDSEVAPSSTVPMKLKNMLKIRTDRTKKKHPPVRRFTQK